MTRDDLANLIHDMMTGNPKTDPDLHVGSGERNTTVMYRDSILVIHDPNTRDGGTIFKPDNGFKDFLRYTAPIINAPPNIGTPTHTPQPVGPAQTNLPPASPCRRTSQHRCCHRGWPTRRRPGSRSRRRASCPGPSRPPGTSPTCRRRP